MENNVQQLQFSPLAVDMQNNTINVPLQRYLNLLRNTLMIEVGVNGNTLEEVYRKKLRDLSRDPSIPIDTINNQLSMLLEWYELEVLKMNSL